MLSGRFKEAQRSDVKTWINHRYGVVWGLADWPFRIATDLVTVTAGSQTVTGVAADFGKVVSLTRNDGYRLKALPPGLFFDRYYSTASPTTGDPLAYTIVGTSILVGPTPVTTSTTYELLYVKSFTELSADADIAAIPTEFHLMLVNGASSQGLLLENDPTWEPLERAYQSDLQALRVAYGRATRDNFGSFEYAPVQTRLARDVDTGL